MKRFVPADRAAVPMGSVVFVKSNPGNRTGLVAAGKGITPPLEDGPRRPRSLSPGDAWGCSNGKPARNVAGTANLRESFRSVAKVLYLLLTFLESIPAVLGIRAFTAEAPYRVVATLGDDVEVRAYAPCWVAETGGSNDGFSRLFGYIAGSNGGSTTIAMTAPVEQRFAEGERPMPGKGEAGMRFFLPAKAGDPPPKPDDPGVRLVHLPERTVAVLRYSGSFGARRFEAKAAELERVLAAAGRRPAGRAFFMGYDPPFTLPFLRRNEAAIDLAAGAPS